MRLARKATALLITDQKRLLFTANINKIWLCCSERASLGFRMSN